MEPTADEFRGIWAVVSPVGERLTDAGARLLGAARGLADAGGGALTALLLEPPTGAEGGNSSGRAREAIAYGADTVLLLRDSRLAETPAAAAAAVATLAARERPAIILLADGPATRELAPRLARRLGSGLVSAVDPDAIDLDTGSGTLLATRREWSGRLLTTYAQPEVRPQVVTVRVAAALSPYYDDWRSGVTTTADLGGVPWPGATTAVTRPASVHATPVPPDGEPAAIAASRALRAARCVVVGGRGVGSADGFARVQRLAAALGGEWAASGGVVDAGWAPPEREVSLYATSVRPDLYIGCGVSGSPQHVVAMQQARTIVAINTDPEAPIFRWAHYAIVADCATLLDGLLARLAPREQGPR